MSITELDLRQPRVDVANLDNRALFSSDIDAVMDAVWDERERRLREWAQAGWTQQRIADEVGRDQKTISRWMGRLDVTPQQPHRQHPSRNLGAAPKPAEVVSGEVLPSIADLRPAERSPEVERRLAESRARRDKQAAWTDIETRKMSRITDNLDGLLDALVLLPSETGLSRESIGEQLRKHRAALTHIGSALEDLAHSFAR
jgi:hypothetical protein